MNFFSRKTIFLIYVLFTVNVAKGSDEDGNIWAVLVSTITRSYTYAGEASIYKAYQLLINGGVSPNNIIVFSPDQAAYSKPNLYPGTVYFATDGIHTNSKNVYIGSENIDYSRENNTASNFLAVISGNKSAVTTGSRRVLKTDPDDKVFLYFVGGPIRYEEITFPDYASVRIGKIVSLLEDLQEDKFFKKLLIAFDSSSSGLVFDNYLTEKQGIFAIASGGIKGYFKPCFLEKSLADYTATSFSYNWLKFIERAQNGDSDENDYTILDLLYYAKHSQIENEINIYGNLAAASKTKVSSFFGKRNSNDKPTNSKMIRNSQKLPNAKFPRRPVSASMKDVASGPGEELDHDLINDVMNNIYKESIAGTAVPITEILNGDYTLSTEKLSCFMNLISALRSECNYMEEQYLSRFHFNKLVNLCALGVPEQKVIDSMSVQCASKKTQ